jgi:very-short-patch-repair endonuclease
MKKQEMPLFYGAKPETFRSAKLLRKRMTPAEKLLWDKLKNKQLNNLKFRRQHPIHFYIADFYCHEKKLVVELDGKIHLKIENVEWDKNRTALMNDYDIKVIRFTNEEVMSNIDSVLAEIARICA